MKIIIDQKKIRQRASISNVMSVGGLFALLACVVLPLFKPETASYSFVLMIVGLGVSMIGIYFANRWVRKPRPEDQLDKALKSLSDSCHLYHYPALPCDHLLLTPFGVMALETVGLSGRFTYRNGRWKESMSMGRALRYIVEERLGDPTRAAASSEAYLLAQIEKLGIPPQKVPLKSVVVFTHPAVEFEADNAPKPVVKVDKLRKQVSTTGMRMDEGVYRRLDEYFSTLTVRD